MLNLVYIVNARMPTEKAHGYQIAKMCEEFTRAGASVELIVPTRDNPIDQDVFTYYKLDWTFAVRKVKSYDFLRWVGVHKAAAFYAQSLAFWLKLWRLPLEKEIIVYTRNPEIVWLFKRRGFRVAYECHDWFGKKKNLALFLLKKCDLIITTNPFIREQFLKHNFAPRRILLAPNGVNVDLFGRQLDKKEAVNRLPLGREQRGRWLNSQVLLYTGSFRTMGEDKGIADIFKALKILKNPQLLFVAVGGNKEDIAYYQSLLSGIGTSLAQQVLLLPRATQQELAIFQQAANILLMPFPDRVHYRYFMTPLKMFEYLAAGKPIIASDLPSIRAVLNSRNCFFCRPDDPLSLASTIREILSSPQEAQRRARHASQDSRQYSWSARAEKILSRLNSLFQ
ncbi:glycosyltransferase [Candidatus Parcubacteria bacterium]|nr:MAG: glycosyltransferase [Candidatus Parcubacteria bacterium]